MVRFYSAPYDLFGENPDRIDIDLAQFQAGRIPSIPLVEIKP